MQMNRKVWETPRKYQKHHDSNATKWSVNWAPLHHEVQKKFGRLYDLWARSGPWCGAGRWESLCLKTSYRLSIHIILFKCVFFTTGCTYSIGKLYMKKNYKTSQEPVKLECEKRKSLSKCMLLGHPTPAELPSCLPTWWSQQNKKHQNVWNLTRWSFTVSFEVTFIP